MIGSWEFPEESPTRPSLLPCASFKDDKTRVPCGPYQAIMDELVDHIRANRDVNVLNYSYDPSLDHWNRLFLRHRFARCTNIEMVDAFGVIKEQIFTALKESGQLVQLTNTYFFLTVLIDRALARIFEGAWGQPLPGYRYGIESPALIRQGYSKDVFLELVSSYRNFDCLPILKQQLAGDPKASGSSLAYFQNLSFRECERRPLSGLLGINLGSPENRRVIIDLARTFLTTGLS